MGSSGAGGAGAVTDRDVVWGRRASWSYYDVLLGNMLSRCHTGTRCHGDKYYCHVTCVHNVPISTNNMVGVGLGCTRTLGDISMRGIHTLTLYETCCGFF